jgi:hypothetical protein
MKNIDCEIYIKQLINFFENNPNDLMVLIGGLQKNEFYNKLREKCEKNLETGDEYILSKQQIVDVIIELKIPELSNENNSEKIIKSAIQKTKWGEINLN